MPPVVTPGALILLSAPFIGPGGWPSEEMKPRDDFSGSLPADMSVRIYHGTKDKEVPFAHAELYAKAIPDAVLIPIENANHQLDDNLTRIAHDLRALDEE
jgi:pimeloyl-ACP methyl ester carboxylesterase